jgi:hypothetical protein
LILLKRIAETRKQTQQIFDPSRVFSKTPELCFAPDVSMCTCGSPLHVRKTEARTIVTRHLGAFKAHETILQCSSEPCQNVFYCDDLDRLVASGARFGYDILEYVGRSMWCDKRAISEIRQNLLQQNILICEREIAYLAKKFVLYLVELHESKQDEIRRFLHRGSGYFLHFDSTHPGKGAAHLMCAIGEEVERRAQIVLGCEKLPTESTETVIAFLKTIKEKYGDPLAGICDMLASNLAAFQEVFPGVLLLICHFHFLRDLGKDWMGYENMLIDNFLKTYDTTSRLKEFIKKCRALIEKSQLLSKDVKINDANFKCLSPLIQAYTMAAWILEYREELHGYGFPFDKANLVYLQRMKKVFLCLHGGTYQGELEELYFMLATILQDPKLQKILSSLEQKAKDFDHLRSIMRIAPKEKGHGLSGDAEDCDMTLVEKQVKQFIDSDAIKNNPDTGYKKAIKQILKYWKMLFAKPVPVKRADGTIELVYPQRTNNLLEMFFRDFLRAESKRTGMDTLSQRVQTMIAETPMIKNLEVPELMKILLDGHPTLADRFVELDIIKRREVHLQQSRSQDDLLPPIKKLIKRPNFFQICTKTFTQERAA